MIILMRHGEDDDTRLGGWSDAGLSSEGIQQAKHASEEIVRAGYKITHIFSSDLKRAKETAEIVAEDLNLKVVYDEEFRETNDGDLAGMSKEQACEEYPGLYWSSLEWEQEYPNGESPKRFFERVKSAWARFKNDTSDGDVLLVTHGGVIDVILCLENGLNYTNKHTTFRIGNAEIAGVQ